MIIASLIGFAGIIRQTAVSGDLVKCKLGRLCSGSVSYQLTGHKSNQIFSPVKIPYKTHSMLNTTSILQYNE